MNKIQGLTPINSSLVKDGKASVKDKGPEESKSTVVEVERDDLVLTEAAVQISKAAEMQQQVPEIDAGKVAAIRAQIENGEYEVSAARIARGIVNFEKLA